MSSAEEVSVHDDREASRFEAQVGGEHAGFAVYERAAGEVRFTHTEVDGAYEGQGVGSALVRGALDAVKSEGLRVVPQCSFVAGYIEQHPDEYGELVEGA